VNDTIFGFGADRKGATYFSVGNVAGSQASFQISGFGLTPGIGPAVSAYVGTVEGDSIVGTFQGVAHGLLAGRGDICNWSGNFVLKPRLECDINGDGEVDSSDIYLILSVRRTRVGPGDPRDVDGDGVITDSDAQICRSKCTHQDCTP
jgi:hypothetical protein